MVRKNIGDKGDLVGKNDGCRHLEGMPRQKKVGGAEKPEKDREILNKGGGSVLIMLGGRPGGGFRFNIKPPHTIQKRGRGCFS